MAITVIHQIIIQKKGDTIVYATNIPSTNIKYLKQKFISKANNLHSYDGDSLILTKQEKSYILNQLEKLKKYKWSNSLFTKSKSVTGEQVWNGLAKDMFWEVHEFSKPIFIRDNSVCLVYYMHFFGVGGPSYFGFFKEQNGQWKEWISIYSGILN